LLKNSGSNCFEGGVVTEMVGELDLDSAVVLQLGGA
jgi:hypothetical protein